ncbi:MAG: hypothetical protein VR65_16060 [Desulfobulbaceae bacterium BRH_c16a]|nr:MAG: hypothetical protein VR65_16060 [Desulfobulbaceae bacterium BRH_c16a]
MIFILAEVLFQKHEKRIDILEDFFAGKSCGEQFGKFLAAAQSEESDEGLSIDFISQAKAHFGWIKIHGGLL